MKDFLKKYRFPVVCFLLLAFIVIFFPSPALREPLPEGHSLTFNGLIYFSIRILAILGVVSAWFISIDKK